MSEVQMESVMWLLGLLLFGSAALFPQALIRLLGRGRVRPSAGILMFSRIASGFCFIGAIYRLFTLYHN